jgi:hypothetical protein
MALKRAAKANRRKAVVAEKRKTELVNGSLAAQVMRAAEMPIQQCLLTGRLFDAGIGTLMLARGATPYNLAVGVFLIGECANRDLAVSSPIFHGGIAALFRRLPS